MVDGGAPMGVENDLNKKLFKTPDP